MNARTIGQAEKRSAAKIRMVGEVQRASRIAQVSLLINAGLAAALVLTLLGLVGAIGSIGETHVMYVKTDPLTGEHQVGVVTEDNPGDRFVEAGVQASLLRYIKARHSENPATIKNDVGMALRYLSPGLREAWIEDGMAARVGEVVGCLADCAVATVQIGSFDTKPVTTPTAVEPIWETTAYFRRARRALGSGEEVGTERMMTRFRWRLKPLDGLPRTVPELTANPHGIEIVEETIERDLLGEQAEKRNRGRGVR